jgi:hypothetical protein
MPPSFTTVLPVPPMLMPGATPPLVSMTPVVALFSVLLLPKAWIPTAPLPWVLIAPALVRLLPDPKALTPSAPLPSDASTPVLVREFAFPKNDTTKPKEFVCTVPAFATVLLFMRLIADPVGARVAPVSTSTRTLPLFG